MALARLSSAKNKANPQMYANKNLSSQQLLGPGTQIPTPALSACSVHPSCSFFSLLTVFFLELGERTLDSTLRFKICKRYLVAF